MSGEYLKQALAKAAKYCSGRELAPYQVLQKLQSWELSEDEAQSVLAQLIDEKFVDEKRFAQAYCKDKFSFNQWGKIRIKQELNRLKISQGALEAGLNRINPTEYEETMTRLASRKWQTLKDDDWVRKQKTMAYLVRKGYEMDLVREVVDQVSASEH